jgi:hypothetical protein
MAMLISAAINGLLVANHRNLVKAGKHIDAVPQLTELDTPFSTHFTANLSDTTQIISLNTSHLT